MSPTPERDVEMPLVEHLIELRKRLLRAVLAVLLVFLCLMPFAQELYAVISAPLRAYLPEGASMIATGVASPFFAPFKLAMVVSLVFSIPCDVSHNCGFIAAGF